MPPATDPPAPQLSLIIPTLNEAEHIVGMLDDLSGWAGREGIAVELVVSDDGSSDDTVALVQARAPDLPPLQLLRSRRCHGKGKALERGVWAARAPLVALMDGDNSFPPAQLDAFLEAVAAGADVVIGSRRLDEAIFLVKPSNIPYIHLRHVVGQQFNYLVRHLTGMPYLDTQCGLKLLRTEVARECFSHVRVGGFVFDLELLLAARAVGYRVAEVPATIIHRDTDPVHRVVRLSAAIGKDLLRVVANLHRGAYGAGPGSSRCSTRARVAERIGPSPITSKSTAS